MFALAQNYIRTSRLKLSQYPFTLLIPVMVVLVEFNYQCQEANPCQFSPHVYNIDARRDMNLRSFLVYVGSRDYKRDCIRELQSVAIFLFVGIFLIHSNLS